MFTCDEVEYYYLLLADADWWKIVWGKLGDKNLGWPVNMQYIYDNRWFRRLAGEMDPLQNGENCENRYFGKLQFGCWGGNWQVLTLFDGTCAQYTT